MHKDFQPYLKSNRLGIDYNYIEDYNTKEVLEKNLGKDHPYWERKIMKALLDRNRDKLKEAIDAAETLHFDKINRRLIEQAKEKFLSMHV